MFPLVMILLFVAHTDTNEHNYRRIHYHYPFILGFISWKKKYVRHQLCTGSILKRGWIISAHFCLDIYNLGDSSNNRTPTVDGAAVKFDKGKYIYEVNITLFYTDFTKEFPTTIVNVTIHNCLSLAAYDFELYQIMTFWPKKGVQYPTMSNDNLINLIMRGEVNRDGIYGHLLKYWFRNPEIPDIYSVITSMYPCSVSKRENEFPNWSFCAWDHVFKENYSSSYDFEYFGTPFIYQGKIAGISYYPVRNEKYITLCSTVANWDWLEKTVIEKKRGTRYDVDVSLDIDIDSTN